MTDTLTRDKAILKRLLASREIDESDVAPCGGTQECYDAHDWLDDFVDIHEKGISIADVIEKRRRITWREAQEKQHADRAKAKSGTPDVKREVTKLPEVHDHAGDDLPFHIPAGKATQVLGSREIDPSRVPDQLNPLVTDSNGRALAPRSALAREREALKVMREHEALKKLMRKWGVKRFSYSFSR
jgi:hypothetical protein